MSATNVEVLVFAGKDDPHAGFTRARILTDILKEQGLSVTFVDVLSTRYEDLLLIAKHGVLDSPRVLVLDEQRLLMQKHGVPSARDVLQLLT